MSKKNISSKLIYILILIIIVSMPISAFAHSGRTDSSGGHRDNKNASGLGYYHYHCGGNPPHLHKNVVCPYDNVSATNYKPKTNTSSSTNISTTDAKNFVYSDIVAKINSIKIPSFNYNNMTYINSEYLSKYGFDVAFDEKNKTLTISRNKSKSIEEVNDTTKTAGTMFATIVDSDIKVYLNDGKDLTQIISYNANSYMYIALGDLSLYGDMAWDANTRTSSLALSE